REQNRDRQLNPGRGGTAPPKITLRQLRSKNLQRVQHRPDARDFVGAEQIRLAQRGKHSEERLGAADFLAEKFKRVRQRVADGKTQLAQPERVHKNLQLMPHAHDAVLQVAVVKAKAGVYEDFFHAAALRHFNLARKKIPQGRNRVGGQIKVADRTDVFTGDVADDDGGIVRGDHFENFL